MPPGRPPGPTPRYEEQRQRILEAATVLFAEHGFEGTGLRAIAEAAGLRPGSLYHYFPSKEAIMAALIEDTVRGPRQGIRRLSAEGGLDDCLYELGLSFLERIARPEGRRRFEVVLRAAHERPAWAARYLQGVLDPAERDLAEMLRRRLPAAALERVDPTILAKQINGALIAFLIHEELLRPGGSSTEQRQRYVRQLVDVLVAGVKALAAEAQHPATRPFPP
jgi:AcrR family transcriptional regulator